MRSFKDLSTHRNRQRKETVLYYHVVMAISYDTFSQKMDVMRHNFSERTISEQFGNFRNVTFFMFFFQKQTKLNLKKRTRWAWKTGLFKNKYIHGNI